MPNRIVRLAMVLTDEQIEMAKSAARIDAAECGGDAGNWRSVLIGIALAAFNKGLPERAAPTRDSASQVWAAGSCGR